MSDEIRAIPTVFGGVEYRSRLEADFARVLTLLSVDFGYEERSFLTRDGRHFWPDFAVEGCRGTAARQFIEVRGYESERASATLAAFGEGVERGDLGASAEFFVLASPDLGLETVAYGRHAGGHATVTWRSDRWMFARTGNAAPWRPCSIGGVWWSRQLEVIAASGLVNAAVRGGRVVVERRGEFVDVRDLPDLSGCVASYATDGLVAWGNP